MMNCRSCGSQLPPGAKVCPTCGTPVPAYYSGSGTPSIDPTVVAYPGGIQSGSSPAYGPMVEPTVPASPPDTPPQPSTAYGSTPNAPPSSYSDEQNTLIPPPPPPNPYVTQQARPQPSYPPPAPTGPQGQKQARRFPAGLIALLIVLVLLLIGGGALIYYTTIYRPNQMRAQATATAAVQLTGTARINATATALNPYTHSGTLVLSDPLSDNSKGVNWAQDPVNCGFTGGAYHVKAPDPRYFDDCLANTTSYSNFAFEVQMQIVQGDGGGVLFRDQDTAQAYRNYALDVYQDGSYNLNMYTGSNNPTLASGSSAAIKQGLNQVNLIAVIAQGSTMTVYANHQQIASVTDNSLSNGRIGFEANPRNGHPTEIIFSNVKVWTL